MNNSHQLKLFCYRWALSSLVSLSLSTTAWAYTVNGCFVDINNNGVAGLTVTASKEGYIFPTQALEIAIRHVKPKGIIVLVTDASLYDDANLVEISEGLKKKAIKFNPFVTGDCSDEESWNAIPNQP